MGIIVISVETDAGTYRHSALDVTEAVARECAERLFAENAPLSGENIRTIALLQGRRMVDVFDGEWSSMRDLDS